ncbi:hypothetical protein L0657_21685 [Dyadobacter sp. CY345]|uniref:hypothetical protein n=1 Tax=Dyadobacter sp. CY345 TaxID=2909335 RepID=UPI001F24004B|nr:hypothetical protein [Dyadobacter sp. CY345]MCF2446584.1 hypothetical protein [Dyadobacter sp. CY345]
MKKLFKILLPVCILLFGGYVRLSGHPMADSGQDSSLENDHRTVSDLVTFYQDCHELVIKPVSTDLERENALNRAAKVEEKEDELQSFRKHLDFNGDLHVAFTAPMTGFFIYDTKRYLFSYNKFSYIPSYSTLFLRLGVLRI